LRLRPPAAARLCRRPALDGRHDEVPPGERESSELIYTIILYDIETETEVALTDTSYDAIGPSVKGHLATWLTYEHSGGSFA
jgi:hypothetical protein